MHTKVEVCIIGAGIGGIVQSIKLADAGCDSVIIFDKSSDVGGTWSWNKFPGAACDVNAYEYLPQLARTKFVPSKKYISAPEIADYLRKLARQTGFYDKCHLNTRVDSAVFDESVGRWIVQTNKGDRVSAKFLINALGPLSTPRMPDINNMDTFKGTSYHTAQWPEGLDLTGKTVGVIGTGATAVQVIPEVAKECKKLIVFQRNASYCMPRMDEPTPQDLGRKLIASPNLQVRQPRALGLSGCLIQHTYITCCDVCCSSHSDLHAQGGQREQ